MATYAPNQLHQVPLVELQPDPTQPRKYLDPVALEELTASVIQNGIIEPMTAMKETLDEAIPRAVKNRGKPM